MSLLDDLEKVRNRKPAFAAWLQARTDDERTAFESAATDTNIATDALVTLVRKYGGATTRETLQMWRDQRVAR